MMKWDAKDVADWHKQHNQRVSDWHRNWHKQHSQRVVDWHKRHAAEVMAETSWLYKWERFVYKTVSRIVKVAK